jgi:hypothetical protein
MRLLDFSVYYFFELHCGPGVNTASNKNEYQESSGGGLPAHKADNLTAICELIV